MQNTLDLLSQVLFVALMAMLLYVLYRRFIAMLSKGRIQGEYARVVDVTKNEQGQWLLTVDAKVITPCTVSWEGGQEVHLECTPGVSVHVIETEQDAPDEVRLDFGNQVVRRRVAS